MLYTSQGPGVTEGGIVLADVASLMLPSKQRSVDTTVLITESEPSRQLQTTQAPSTTARELTSSEARHLTFA